MLNFWTFVIEYDNSMDSKHSKYGTKKEEYFVFLLIIDNKLFLPLLVLATMPEASSELIVTQQFDTTNVKVVVVWN